MRRKYRRICRVCMSEGSRNIFNHCEVNAIETASPLDRLLEKLRYVTMMKIEENDDLPRLLCDLCIVQLNVAYNFKRQAVENDTKLRQYYIECGISSENGNQTININEATTLRNSLPQQISPSPNHLNMPTTPIPPKSEPNDLDQFSDTTGDINSDDITRNRLDSFTNTIDSLTVQNQRSEGDFDRNSPMVLIDSNNLNNLSLSSDVEFLQKFRNPNKSCDNIVVSSNLKSTPKHIRVKNVEGRIIQKRKLRKRKAYKREVTNLSIDMQLPPGKISRDSLKKSLKFCEKTKRNKSSDYLNYSASIEDDKKDILKNINTEDSIRLFNSKGRSNGKKKLLVNST